MALYEHWSLDNQNKKDSSIMVFNFSWNKYSSYIFVPKLPIPFMSQ